MSKIPMLLVSMLIQFPLLSSQAEVFQLISIGPKGFYVYENRDTGEAVSFNITKRETYIHGSDALYVNFVKVNRTTTLSPLAVNTIHVLNNDASPLYNISFGDIQASSYWHTARGNFLALGNETRDININNVLFPSENITITFKNANRGQSTILGEPTVDFMTIEVREWNASAELYIGLTYKVVYEPSDSFNITFKTITYQALNITEKFFPNFAQIIINGSNTFCNYETGMCASLDLFEHPVLTRKYVMVGLIGLPVIIEPYTQLVSSVRARLAQSNQESFSLVEYSWQISGGSSTVPFSLWPLLLVLPVLSVVLRKRYRR